MRRIWQDEAKELYWKNNCQIPAAWECRQESEAYKSLRVSRSLENSWREEFLDAQASLMNSFSADAFEGAVWRYCSAADRAYSDERFAFIVGQIKRNADRIRHDRLAGMCLNCVKCMEKDSVYLDADKAMIEKMADQIVEICGIIDGSVSEYRIVSAGVGIIRLQKCGEARNSLYTHIHEVKARIDYMKMRLENADFQLHSFCSYAKICFDISGDAICHMEISKTLGFFPSDSYAKGESLPRFKYPREVSLWGYGTEYVRICDMDSLYHGLADILMPKSDMLSELCRNNKLDARFMLVVHYVNKENNIVILPKFFMRLLSALRAGISFDCYNYCNSPSAATDAVESHVALVFKGKGISERGFREMLGCRLEADRLDSMHGEYMMCVNKSSDPDGHRSLFAHMMEDLVANMDLLQKVRSAYEVEGSIIATVCAGADFIPSIDIPVGLVDVALALDAEICINVIL
jgi:hypothetical protein